MSADPTVPRAYPLEPSASDMRDMAHAATEFLVDFIERLPNAPASDLDGALEAARRMREEPPEAGSPFNDLLQRVAEGAAKGFNTTGPGYLAYIPGGGLFAAALADFLACGVNRFVNLWNAAPAFAEIEATVIRWLAQQFGYPPEARGILTSGGSMANFSAIVTARRTRLAEDFLRGTVYVSAQTHASVAKSAVLAGFPAANVRKVPCASGLEIDLEALTQLIKEDRAAGFQPFFLVANAGTTNTGAVDAIADCVEVARREGLWLHVDGAYGGFFQLTDRGRALFRGIEDADSIVLDPHKGMFLPYGTGCLLVRDGRLLRDAHRVGADYLQDLAPEGEIPNFTDYSPELSRDFRGLRVWLPIKLHGLGAFRAALDEKLDLTQLLYEELRATPGFELRWRPRLTVVAFRYLPARGDPEDFNRRLLDRIIASKRVFLSSTLVDGRFTIRACVVSHRTHRDRIEEAAEIIKRSAKELEEGL
ncbi:MAG TPA: aminotransferase class I/II-fold pyridoxal phosphate-dependent enzyme [Actinomycetota bacterium]|nr:aminotransferase class I/II-fold pyridoxal phosphate-dependent enzyme [Actinomycetota bacterium]